MRVKDVRLHATVKHRLNAVRIEDQDGYFVFAVLWGRRYRRTKSQAIAMAERLCERFNSGQGGK